MHTMFSTFKFLIWPKKRENYILFGRVVIIILFFLLILMLAYELIDYSF